MIHWQSGLMSVNPDLLVEMPVTITRGVQSLPPGQQMICLTLRNIKDSLEQTITLTYDLWDIPQGIKWNDLDDLPLDHIDKTQMPRSIQQLYDDFGVHDYNEFMQSLAGRTLTGIYFVQRLIGFEKDYDLSIR